MSRPSARTQRVYGVSFSVANFFANSSGTTAFPAMLRSWLRRLPDLRLEVALDEVGGEDDFRVVLRRVLELLEVVQAAIPVDAIDRRDQAHWPCRVGVEVLVNGVRRDVDHVPRFPLVAFHLRLRLPVVG